MSLQQVSNSNFIRVYETETIFNSTYQEEVKMQALFNYGDRMPVN